MEAGSYLRHPTMESLDLINLLSDDQSGFRTGGLKYSLNLAPASH